jgi:hypothetical protein
MDGPSYWASGGEVRGRAGPLTRTRALDVAGFLARQAEARRHSGDPAAADLFSGMALELRAALAATDDWRRAAGGSGAAYFVRDANSRTYS